MTFFSSLSCFNGLETGQHLGAGSQQRICPPLEQSCNFHSRSAHTRSSLSFHPSMPHGVPAGQGCPPHAAEILATRHISHVAFSRFSSQHRFPAGLRVVLGRGKAVLHSTTRQCRYFSSAAGRCLGDTNSSGLSCYRQMGNRELDYSGNVFALLLANLLPLTIFMWHSPALNAVCSPTGSSLPFAVVSPPTSTLRYFSNFTVLPDNATDTS